MPVRIVVVETTGGKIGYSGSTEIYLMPMTVSVNYGALYTYAAISHSNNIAASGWHVSTRSDMESIAETLDPTGSGITNEAAKYMKESGTTSWNTDTSATNSSGFSGRGAGVRSSDGSYSWFMSKLGFWHNEIRYDNRPDFFHIYVCGMDDNDNEFTYNDESIISYQDIGDINNSQTGANSCRLVKDSTSLSEGEFGNYTGNNGKYYNTKVIGGVEILLENLSETKYRNGNWIPFVESAASWDTDDYTSDMMCAPNGVKSNISDDIDDYLP